MISKYTIDKVNEAANLLDVVGKHVQLHKQGKDHAGACPFCGEAGKPKKRPFTVVVAKDVWKCFKCDKGGKGPTSFLMAHKNITYPEAVEELAKEYGIDVEQESKKPQPQRAKVKEGTKSFRDEQLQLSGIPLDAVKAKVWVDDDTQKEIERYQAATINEQWQIITPGDDIVMHYIGLDDKPMMFFSPSKRKNVPMIRMRWQNPHHHADKYDNPMKYQSPYKSGSHIWIPEPVRRRYKEKIAIETLYIQEGEKKADKATMCGMFSVGIMGINNIAQGDRLPHEFELIIKACQVKNVVFVLDSDWQDLSHNITKAADQRPKQFKTAVVNFSNHFYAFNRNGVHLRIFFAHVKKQAENAEIKGMDDLLVSKIVPDPLKDVRLDFEETMAKKSGEGKWINCYDITGKTEYNIREIMKLHSTEAFVELHKEELMKRGVFKIERLEWRFTEEGKLELAQPLMPDEQYWQQEEVTDRSGKTKTIFKFNYTGSINFLKNRGFSRIQALNGDFKFVLADGKVLKDINAQYIRDFVMDFTRSISEPEVLELLYRGGKQYLGPEKFSDIPYSEPKLFECGKNLQYLFFRTKFWKITPDTIEEKPLADLDGHTWSNKIIDFEASLVPDLVKAQLITQDMIDKLPEEQKLKWTAGTYSIDFSKDAQHCHFLRFLWNASDFYHEKSKKDIELSAAEALENAQNFINKMTGIGYLLHSYFDSSNAKAIIGQDATMTEVGDSEGRSGKSLIGDACEQLIPTVAVPGKAKDIMEDRFVFDGVDENTALVFIDDVRANFDFEFLFPHITGRFRVNPKGGKAFTIPKAKTPKIYISTNHGLNETDGSTRDRMAKMAFSDFYNEFHRPIDDFKVRFFEEWDTRQWNLFYSFMANCLRLYFQFGRVVPAPSDRLEMRRLKQLIGEAFLDWAESYYINKDENNPELKNLNQEIPKDEVYKAFIDKYPLQAKFVNIGIFKKKLRFFCEFKGYKLNPGRPYKKQNWGGDIKKGGVEYVIVTTKDYVPNTK